MEYEAVPAVRKGTPGDPPCALFEHADKDILFDFAISVQRPRAPEHCDEKDSRGAEDERDGRAFNVKARTVHGLNAEKGVRSRQQPAEGKRQRKKRDDRDEILPSTPPADGDNGKQRSAQKFDEICRPDGKPGKRKDDRHHATQCRCGKQVESAHPAPRTPEGKKQEKPVKQAVFQKHCFHIDDHFPAPCLPL